VVTVPDSIVGALRSGDKVEIRWFGSFRTGSAGPWSFYIFHQFCFDSTTPAGESPSPICICLY